MNPSIELQKQIKDNAEDVRRFVSDLSSWEEDMKRKESEGQATTSKESAVPPVRNTSKKRDSDDNSVSSFSGDSRSSKKRISSSDYAAWEKFDVEKACDEIDDPTLRNKSKSEEDQQIREKRLRDEANVEKEKGNQFVQKEKWDSAIECYSKAIKCYSRDAIYYCNRALCYLKKKDYRAAETDCTSALVLDNTYVKALHRRGLARKELNQLEEAVEDLQRAYVMEPLNSAIRRDLTTVRLKITPVTVETLLEAQSMESETETVMCFNSEKNVPILPAKKHRPPTATSKEPLVKKEPATATSKEPLVKKELASPVNWPILEDGVVVEPIVLPPHKRSKKPLVRIQIQEGGNIASTSGGANLHIPSLTEDSTNLAQDVLKKSSEKMEELPKSNTICEETVQKIALAVKPGGSSSSSKPEVSLNPLPEVIPSVPKNSVQFVAGWRQINKSSNMCFQYLKQIKGEEFPKIFQDSLDGNILTQILNVLATEFIAANEPVLSYIQGLTQVRRFRTLTLFLSQSDKKNMDSLLKHTQKLEDVSSDIVIKLKKEYEL